MSALDKLRDDMNERVAKASYDPRTGMRYRITLRDETGEIWEAVGFTPETAREDLAHLLHAAANILGDEAARTRARAEQLRRLAVHAPEPSIDFRAPEPPEDIGQ